MAKLEDRAVGFSSEGPAGAFGHVGAPSGAQLGESNRVTPWMKANPSYARQGYYDPNYNEGNVYTNAAIRSGVVSPGGYSAIQTQAGHSDPQHSWAPIGHSSTSFGRKGGQPINPMLRFRTSGDMWKSTGWRGQLTQSSGPNKAFELGGAGHGQSSEDSTTAVYSTEETRMGTRAWFTDETWNEAKTKFGQTWAGYKSLGPTDGTPFLNAQLGQMFARKSPNVGFARRVKRGL